MLVLLATLILYTRLGAGIELNLANLVPLRYLLNNPGETPGKTWRVSRLPFWQR